MPKLVMISAALLLLHAGGLRAQVADSRSAAIEAARSSKLQEIQAQDLSGGQKKSFFSKVNLPKRLGSAVSFLRLTRPGLRAKFGGISSGAGLGLGGEYARPDLAGGEVLFRTAARVSHRLYQKYDLQLAFPSFGSDRFFLNLYSVQRNYPQVAYYGPGPDSRKSDRTNFRLENTAFDGTIGIRPLAGMQIGYSLGYLFTNVGPGTHPGRASAEAVFSPVAAPGIDHQADFLRHAVLAQFDYRDNPKGPRSGGYYAVEYSRYLDRSLSLHDFRRLDFHIQQYLPLFNKQRVLALRGRSVLTFEPAGQRVPFYLQSTLGSSEYLRGFRSFRFRDLNTMAATVEYQWPTFRWLDMVIFLDGGKVFPRRSQLNFKDWEASPGFGLRVQNNHNVLFRLDTGFSHEGFEVWIRFGSLFGDGPDGLHSTL